MRHGHGLRWPVIFLLPLVVLGVYASSLDAPFVFDDREAIVENPHVRGLWPLEHSLSAPPQSPVSGRPVAALSLALNHALTGMSPRGFRLGNLALHLGSALLVFALLRRTLRTPRLAPRFHDMAGRLAFCAALAWAVHPLNTEAVVYVTQRTELLCAFFVLGTLYAAVRARDPSAGWGWTASSVACALLAVGSKEVGIAAPLLVVLWDRVFGAPLSGRVVTRRLRLHALTIAARLRPVRSVATGPRSASVGFHHGIDPLSYLFTQAGVILHYLHLVLWPAPLHVTYAWPLVRAPLEGWGPVAVLAGGLLLTLYGLARRHPLGFVGGAVFVLLAPSSSIVPIVTEIVAERRMYLPSAALVSALVMLLWTGALLLGTRAAAQLMLGALIVLACVVSHQRLDTWKDPVALYAWDVSHQPDNDLALNLLGLEHAAGGRLAEAEACLDEARRLRPRYPPYLTNLASVRRARERTADALPLYEEAARLVPEDAEVLKQLALTLVQLGRLDEAERRFAEVAALLPRDPSAHWNLAGVQFEQGRLDLALRSVRAVARLDPHHSGARAFLEAHDGPR